MRKAAGQGQGRRAVHSKVKSSDLIEVLAAEWMSTEASV